MKTNKNNEIKTINIPSNVKFDKKLNKQIEARMEAYYLVADENETKLSKWEFYWFIMCQHFDQIGKVIVK